ncbi:pikachurin-like [Ischnura elegans]|uniref:pikachurin-like n=1 Tax=Ischnura elegans TaxID=197161 RepID=UPI001ED871EF|nr:pikachurin-like [Ischnura elegans]
MAGVRRLILRCLLLLVTAISAHPALDGVSAEASEAPPSEQFEAAFQGRCGPGSPCEHLCFELHDGTFECDCRTGFVLRHDGYGCFEANATAEPPPVVTTSAPKPESTQAEEEEDILYQKDASFSAERDFGPSESPSPSPIGVSFVSAGPGLEAHAVPTPPPQEVCLLDCGPGSCLMEDLEEGDATANAGPDSPSRRHRQRCQCPLGRGGERCEKETSVVTPHFTGQSYVAFPALKDAYKAVRLSLEFRPDEGASDGIILLAGERDDMAGDFMAIVIRESGDVEFWFDCGSGVGVVKAAGTAAKGAWNRLRLSRHRWDAWLSLNDADRTHGRSKGLFSRITFREPLFVGGPGNTTGLLGGVPEDDGGGGAKLPTDSGFKGCVRNLEVNGRKFRFAAEDAPPGQRGDATKGFDVGECEVSDEGNSGCKQDGSGGACPEPMEITSNDADEGPRAPCSPSGRTDIPCKGPIIHVPAFNGTSYLQHPGLDSFSVSSWLEIEITFKAQSLNGLLLYNGRQGDGVGDFVAMHLSHGILIFTFDLGTGSAHIRSTNQITLGTWHEARVSRTGRLAILSIDGQPGNRAMTPGAFTQLSLGPKHPLYIGGVPTEHAELISPKVAQHHAELMFGTPESSGSTTISSFVGCIQKVVINNRVLDLVPGSQAGVNIESCPHPCRASPCPHGAICVPQKEFYSCECHSGISNGRGAECGSDQLVPDDEDEEDDDVVEDEEEEREDEGQEGGDGPLAEPLLGRRRRMREGGGSKAKESTTPVEETATPAVRLNEVPDREDDGLDESSAVPGFTGDSYLHYTDVDTIKRIVNDKIDINMRFKVTSESGVLLWSGQHGGGVGHHSAAGQTGDFLALGLRSGYIHLRFNLGSGEVELEYNASRVDDGLWHRVRATRSEQEGTIVVDSGPVVSNRSPGRLRQLNTNSGLYIGGVESVETWTQGQYTSGIVGCISDLVLDGESPLPLPLPPKSAVTMKTSSVLQHDLKLRKGISRPSLRKINNPHDSAHVNPAHFSSPSLSVIGHNILRCH